MGCGNALTKFRGVTTRSALAALLFRLTVVSLPLAFGAPSAKPRHYLRQPFGVRPAGATANNIEVSLSPPLGMASEPPVVNVVHAVLKALRIGSFMGAQDWAKHLRDAGVHCTANDLTYIVFREPGLKHVLGDAKNAYGVYMRMTGNKKYYQILAGGPCDESLRGLEPPALSGPSCRPAACR